MESRLKDDHQLTDQTYPILNASSGQIVIEQAPALTALNERLRNDFVKDSNSGVAAWNKKLADSGVGFEFVVPHKPSTGRSGLSLD